MSNSNVTTKILTFTLLVIISLAAGLMAVMTYFMYSLTDTTMLATLKPMAKTAAQSVEGNLHTLADRFFLIRENPVFISPSAGINDKRAAINQAALGIEFVWLGLYDPDGGLVTGTEHCPRTISGRQLYASLRETKNLAIEDTYIGTSGPEIVMGVPVPGEPGNVKSPVVSYLVGSYRYDVLSDVLRNINIGTNGSAFIINDKGILLAHKDLGKVYSRQSITNNLGVGAGVRDVLLSMRQGQTGSADVRGPEGQLFVSYSPIRGTLWSLGIQAPRSDFLGATRNGLFAGAFITIVSLVFFTFLLSVSVRKILSRPLGAITDNARELANGNFDHELPKSITGRDDEIGQLGAAFTTMSGSVKGVISDIVKLTEVARAGELDKRADSSAYEGDYRLIIAGMNASLDVFCSHLDTMPGALMLLNKFQEPIYQNRAMRDILIRHGFDADKRSLLASVLSSGASTELPPEAKALFEPQSGDGLTFKADVTIPDLAGLVSNYSLSLRRAESGADGFATRDEDAVCVMLILNDVTMLTRAKIDAETASRAKGDFLSRMSHEMRTPMNAIIGMASIGRSADDIERKEYCLSKISEASQHLLGVINDILDMSKIEADKFELSFNEFNFEKMLQRVTGVINFKVEEKAQNLFVEIDKDIPLHLVSDEQRLAQVVTNLLSNAVKFTPEEGSIVLKAEKVTECGDACTIRITVKDSGIGISEEHRDRLFSSFEQADGSISRKYGGTGLGLAISKRIVELMGGHIWIESELGKGSTFIFDIVAARGSEQPDNQFAPGVDWKTLRVLVVDDAPEILDLFTSMFAPYGVRCETALSGFEALELVGEDDKPFDLVFVDWRMPEMNGIELTRLLMDRPGPKPVVVLITAADWMGIEEEARAAGVSRFLQKPIFPSALVDCVNESLAPEQSLKEHAPEDDSSDGIFAGKRILLAEDVEINREIAMALLEHTGIQIDPAFDGEEAVHAFSEAPGRYDLILMDVHMPKVDGYEATRRIRASGLPGAETIPIIAMTANVFREDIERCLASGMNDHLGKPIDPDAVIATLRNWLA